MCPFRGGWGAGGLNNGSHARGGRGANSRRQKAEKAFFQRFGDAANSTFCFSSGSSVILTLARLSWTLSKIRYPEGLHLFGTKPGPIIQYLLDKGRV